MVLESSFDRITWLPQSKPFLSPVNLSSLPTYSTLSLQQHCLFTQFQSFNRYQKSLKTTHQRSRATISATFAQENSPLQDEDDDDDNESKTTKRFTFNYLNPETQAEVEAELEAARQETIQEYEQLKATLLKRTWRFGTLFSGYLLFQVSGEAAFAALVGAAASYAYVTLLFKDIDAYNDDTAVPSVEADTLPAGFPRNVAKVAAAYKQALFSSPRLLIPVALIASMAAINAISNSNSIGGGGTIDGILSARPALDLVVQACGVGGFILSFKTALVQQVYDELKPKPLTAEELMKAARPAMPDLPDVKADIYGRNTEKELL
jgi:hypothetical protein